MLTVVNRLVQTAEITIRTPQGLTTFCQGLDGDEVRDVCALVRQALAAIP